MKRMHMALRQLRNSLFPNTSIWPESIILIRPLSASILLLTKRLCSALM